MTKISSINYENLYYTVWVSTHGNLQLKHQTLRVAGCIEEVCDWFNYPHASTHPRCKVTCPGVPNRPALLLHQGQPDGGESCIVLESRPTRSLAVCEFYRYIAMWTNQLLHKINTWLNGLTTGNRFANSGTHLKVIVQDNKQSWHVQRTSQGVPWEPCSLSNTMV